MPHSHKSAPSHNINFFLCAEKYGELRELCARLDIPRSELIRKGIDMVLNTYVRDESNKISK